MKDPFQQDRLKETLRNIVYGIPDVQLDSLAELDHKSMKEALFKVFESLADNQAGLYKVLDARLEQEQCFARDPLGFNRDFEICLALAQMDINDSAQTVNGADSPFVPVCPGWQSPFFASVQDPSGQSLAEIVTGMATGRESLLCMPGGQPLGQCFLAAGYDELRNLCQPAYTGSLHMEDGQIMSVQYSLDVSPIFVEKERPLFFLALLYGLYRPVVYSPWARRAVRLRIASTPDGVRFFDPALADNGLEGKLLTGQMLVWNVHSREGEVFQKPECSPDGAHVRYNYKTRYSKNDKVFCCPDLQEADWQKPTLDAGGNASNWTLTFCLDRALPEHDRTFTSHTLRPVPQMPGQTRNCFDLKPLLPERLRTRADVEVLLSCFNDACKANGMPYELNLIERQPAGLQHILQYCGEYRYGERDPKRYQSFWREASHRPDCYLGLAFAGDGSQDTGNKNFIVDFGNYALHYLQTRYPEFDWHIYDMRTQAGIR